MIGYDHLPRSQWTNDYPIVLVHGFCGWTPDESPAFGDYWKYLSDPIITKHHKLYQVDLGPVQSLHDRACELYQQLIGIIPFKEQRGLVANDGELARAVYGSAHFCEHHAEQTVYKPRYIRQVKQQFGKIYGFPKGIPGGWNKQRKVHIIAHSQGSQTVRYL